MVSPRSARGADVFTVAALAAAAVAATAPVGCAGQRLAPVVIPDPPTPYWSWDTIPTAFHGANKSGVFADDAVALLARHQMVTIEKWYTPCASQGPTQGPPSCAVEGKIEHALSRVKKINPNVTGILYLNSMLDFAFYTLHGELEAAEARGLKSFLRDDRGEIMTLCNDGDVYCNVTTFDWTQPHVRELWIHAVTNATATGFVDGIFADHSAQENIQIGAPTNGQGPNQLCNGAGGGRRCYNFTDEFKKSFNSWHLWATNASQALLSKTTGGPVICGPLARYGANACDFDSVRNLPNGGRTVVEASGSGSGRSHHRTCQPDRDCIAAFLAGAHKGTYLTCFAGAPIEWPEQTYPLGEPHGDAVEGPTGVWTRRFASGTVVRWDNNAKNGTVAWGGGQPPPPPPPPSPPPAPPPPPQPQPPAVCGKLRRNTAVGEYDIEAAPASSVAECCAMCEHNAACKIWAWHAEAGGPRPGSKPMCHLHTAQGEIHPLAGCYAGVMNRTGAPPGADGATAAATE